MKFFISACVFVSGLLLKVGAPLEAVVLGAALAAFWNWKGPRIPWLRGARAATR